jgi:hypothetical protein
VPPATYTPDPIIPTPPAPKAETKVTAPVIKTPAKMIAPTIKEELKTPGVPGVEQKATTTTPGSGAEKKPWYQRIFSWFFNN